RRLRLMACEDSEKNVIALPFNNPEAMASQRELGNVLSDAVDSLPTGLRVVFTLRMVEQLSTQETAECLDLTPSNVKIRLQRARQQLQTWIDRQIGEESRRLYMFDGERCDRIVKNVLQSILEKQ